MDLFFFVLCLEDVDGGEGGEGGEKGGGEGGGGGGGLLRGRSGGCGGGGEGLFLEKKAWWRELGGMSKRKTKN